MGSKGLFFSSESSHVAYQINKNEAENTMEATFSPFYALTIPGWGQKVKKISEGHLAYQI